MFTKKEIAHMIAAIFVVSFAISIWKFEIFPYAIISFFFIILTNVVAKKISAYNFESEMESNIWETQRYGFKAHKYFNKPKPIGIFLPIITSLISLGYFIWMSVLVFDVKPKT